MPDQQQNSERDFTHVLFTQLEMQLHGENLTPNEVLGRAYPDDSKKTASIGNSARGGRVKQAYQSDVVKNHLVEQVMLAMHGARAMQQHFCAKPFRQSPGLARMLFDSYDEITKLKAEQEELRAQVSVLQREVRSTKLAEFAFERLLALAVVGVADRVGDWLISDTTGQGVQLTIMPACFPILIHMFID